MFELKPGAGFHCFPDHVFLRYRSFDGDRFFADRVNEFDGPCMQVNAAVAIRSWIAVFNIASDRAADKSKLSPDLVITPGARLNFQQEVPF